MKMTDGFSNWVKWSERGSLPLTHLPGVYAIALSTSNISGKRFSWRPDVIYIGMTNARDGLKSRLQQFDYTIKGGDGHGGAHRVRFKHPDYSRLAPRLYVAICPRECNVLSNEAADLRIMGGIAKHEYDCFAHFVDKFCALPEFNDKKRSPKK